MTDPRTAYFESQAGHADARARTQRVAQAYQAVFDGMPNPEDQKIVREDLEDFCGMRSPVHRAETHDTAHAAGMLRVWQRIHAFRFPRPTDARTSPGGTHERHEPTAGGGIAEPTAE